jgi:anti-sigma B factor antagonist
VADDAAENVELALTTTREGTAALIAVVGELDASSAPGLEELAGRLRTEGCITFTLDMSQTTFIDSSGLRSMLALHTDVAKSGTGALSLQAPSDPVARLLEITGLTEHFTIT